jgi:23S rRNA pseudouridine2604 synthase
MRINRYLAEQGYSTRRGADDLIARGYVRVNGKRAEIGQRILRGDTVEVRAPRRKYRYFAYNKPRRVITHSPQRKEKDIAAVSGIEHVFPIGRLDKDSHGLIILTDDGRVTERLLSPDEAHEKEYRVTTAEKLRPSFASHMEKGVRLEDGYVTRPCTVKVSGERSFTIVLSEGKKHQIRRMCAVLHTDIVDLQRVRIMDVRLRGLKEGEHRALYGDELAKFLKDLGLSAS